MPQVIPPHPIRSGCCGNSQPGQPGRLVLHARNARNHSEEQIERIEGRSQLVPAPKPCLVHPLLESFPTGTSISTRRRETQLTPLVSTHGSKFP
jgi:hypothetical protein